MDSNLVTSQRGDVCRNSDKKTQFSGFEVAAARRIERWGREWKECSLIPF